MLKHKEARLKGLKRLLSPAYALVMAAMLLMSPTACTASNSGNSGADTALGDSVAAKPGKVTLLFAGDAMQHTAQLDAAKERGKGSYDYSDCFTLIAPIVSEVDYAVCNLEVPLGGGPNYSGYPCFSAPDSYARALKDAGFDMMLTANNHCLDSGDRAARRTLTALDSLGIDHIGTYKDAAERERLVPFIKEINGVKFGFLNYTYGTNGIEPKEGMEVALIDREKIAREMKLTRDAGVDILVVAIHWGVEYVLTENENQRRLAQFLVDNGADLIIGGHPHVIQPMEVVHNDAEDKDVLIVYSLGNLISNMKTTDTRGGALVVVDIEPDANGKPRFKKAAYDTFYTRRPGNGAPNFMVYPHSRYSELDAAHSRGAELFERNATKIFDKYNRGVERIVR